jgi:hypothetical protein
MTSQNAVDTGSQSAKSAASTSPDKRRIRRKLDNRLGGADYTHCEGQLSIYDVPGVHREGEGPAGAEGVAQP